MYFYSQVNDKCRVLPVPASTIRLLIFTVNYEDVMQIIGLMKQPIFLANTQNEAKGFAPS